MRWLALSIAAVAGLAACAPAISPPAWLVDGPAILAVVGDAPEVSQGQGTTFRALAVSPDGPVDLSSASWALCTDALPLTSGGSVSEACLGDLASQAQGAAPMIDTSPNACSLFGPLGTPDSLRPRNPDATGGYYQPIRIDLNGALAFAGERLFCPLAQASFAVSVQYADTYPVNQNPVIEGLALTAPGEATQVSPDAIAPGARLTLRLSWPASSNEVFPVYDSKSLMLVDEQEILRVFWFTTAGTLAQSQSAADASGVAASVLWTAPANPGPVYFWAVLRDNRGGAAWTQLQATVEQP